MSRRRVDLVPGRLARLVAERQTQAENFLVKAGWLEPVVVDEVTRSPGPRPMTTAAEVERIRAELTAASRPAGERSIAKVLGVSRDAVRYALGKDHR